MPMGILRSLQRPCLFVTIEGHTGDSVRAKRAASETKVAQGLSFAGVGKCPLSHLAGRTTASLAIAILIKFNTRLRA